jgi:rubredoxin
VTVTSRQKPPEQMTTYEGLGMKVWKCEQCGFEYDEAEGWPEAGFAPGTKWNDIPDDWTCPDCGAAKADFSMMERVA